MSDPSTERPGKRHELTESTRLSICKAISSGESATKVAKEHNISRSTVYDTFKRFKSQQDFKSRPRTGRPQKLSERDTRYICRLARQSPKIEWRVLLSKAPNGVSRSTIQRLLKEKGAGVKK